VSGADDPRWSEVSNQITRLATGELDARMAVEGGRDELDAVAVGLNMLGEQLQVQAESVQRAEGLLQDALDLYEDAPAMFASIGLDLRIIKCNQTLARVLGRHKQELLGRPVRELHLRESRDAVERHLRDFLEVGEHPALEVELLTASGERIASDLSLSATRDEGGQLLRCQAIWTDARPRKAIEARLHQSQRMEALGRLSGGVAHDLNNLLTVILASSMMAQGELPDDHIAAREIDDALEAARRAGELVDRLLAYARLQQVDPQALDLGHLLNDAHRLIQNSVGDAITVIVEHPDVPLVVMADPVQLEQILVNLAINARDATPDGGSVTLSASLEAEEERVRVSVTDQGEGMDPQTRERAFEPFFTTKPVGLGTGLGLAMAHGVITRLGGQIVIDSEPGEGTTVSLMIPLADPRTVRAFNERDRVSVGQGIEVLVVEPRAVLRQSAVNTLRRKGFSVLEAESGEVAVAMAAETGLAIDVLLMGSALPCMQSARFIEDFSALRPAVGIICSASDPARCVGVPCTVLAMPWRADQLVRVVLEVSSEPAEAS